jgi:hypothetical protein
MRVKYFGQNSHPILLQHEVNDLLTPRIKIQAKNACIIFPIKIQTVDRQPACYQHCRADSLLDQTVFVLGGHPQDWLPRLQISEAKVLSQ